MKTKFPPDMHKQLGYYVYRLIDPRNGETFYVGKGKGDRVFAHVSGQLTFSEASEEDWHEDDVSTKIATIREILQASLEVIHIIHRHGMDEPEALQVEAALIDVYPALTNEMAGHDAERGPANAQQLIEAYAAEEINIAPDDKLLFIKTKQATINGRGSVYEAVRNHWKIDPTHAKKADYVCAIVNGLCLGVFIAENWHRYDTGRHGFDGKEAPPKIRKKYMRKRIPAQYAGGQNPIRYINC